MANSAVIKMPKRRPQGVTKKPSICLKIDNTEKILEMVHMTHVTNEILLLYGTAGCGKTTALNYYRNSHDDVIHVEADGMTKSASAIIGLILEAIGEVKRGSNAVIMRFLISNLKDTGKLIIIDEAQHLSPSAFDCLRALNDKADVGIVYSGNTKILKQMYGAKEEDFDQVHSRIGYVCKLKNSFSLEDMEHLFQDRKIKKDCLSLMHKISAKKGGLRRMIKQYVFASNIATALDEELDTYHFEEAAKRMGIGN